MGCLDGCEIGSLLGCLVGWPEGCLDGWPVGGLVTGVLRAVGPGVGALVLRLQVGVMYNL